MADPTRPPFDYEPIIDRPRLDWPGGARLAVWVAVNVEHFELGRPSTSVTDFTAMFPPDPLNYSWRDYGPRVGVWRLMDLLGQLDVPVSALVNSEACEVFPRLVEKGGEAGWRWVAHGTNNSTLQTGMTVEEERAQLTAMTATIERATGRRPVGWLGPALTETYATLDLLSELGYRYVCDWGPNDDQPYPLRATPGPMVSVPYTIELNDLRVLASAAQSGQAFHDRIIDAFEVLHEESAHSGRVLCISLHPFAAGLPQHRRHLHRALAHIAGHDDVWMTTSDEIAAWYLDHAPGPR